MGFYAHSRCIFKISSHRKCMGSYILRKFSHIGRKKSSVTAQVFEDRQKSVDVFLNHMAALSISPALNKLAHSTKNWKFIARDGEKPQKKNFDLPPEVCEDGIGAVSHASLLEKLRSCDSVTSQLDTLSSVLSISPEEIERKKAFCHSFDDIFQQYFPESKVHLFGSSVNGLGFRGCDTDVCFQTNFKDEEPITLKEVPTLQDVKTGKVLTETLSRMNNYYTIRFVRRIFREHLPDLNVLLIKGRVPLLRFYSKEYDVFCDFSCKRKACLLNTKLLRLCGALDSRYVPLAQFFRYWGKYGQFVGDVDRFNSYSFALLVLHFMQTMEQPILPSVQEVWAKSEYLRDGHIDDFELMQKDLKNFKPSENTKTTDALLRDLFFHYLSWDFNRVLIPHLGTSTYKANYRPLTHPEEKFYAGIVSLEDPFRRHLNATCSPDLRSGRKFMTSLSEVCQTYQEPKLWSPETSPQEDWGISSLFRCPNGESSPPTHHEVRVLSTEDASSLKLKKLLEHGLMFKCNEMAGGYLNCRVFNTIVGRQAAKKDIQTREHDSVLDQEHRISKFLQDQGSGREWLCDLKCQWTDGNVLQLIPSRPQPIVMVLLKELIPRILPHI